MLVPTAQRWLALAAVGLLLWMALVAVQGVVLAGQAVGLVIAGSFLPTSFTVPMAAAALFVIVACLLVALVTRLVQPPAALPAMFTAAVLLLLPPALATDALGAIAAALALFALAWLLGDVLLQRLPPADAPPVVGATLAIAAGLGALALGGFAIAAFGQLTAINLAGVAGLLLLVLLVADWRRLSRVPAALWAWRLTTLSWFETGVAGLSIGLVTYALLAAFVPEVMIDATRTHLPIAREIWQTGSIAEFPPLAASQEPVQAHLLLAVAWGAGEVQAAKLVHALAGLVSIAGVAAAGWLVAGRGAAVLSASLFATVPLVLWQFGHAYPDLFATLFTVAAIVCLLLWQRHNAQAWLLCGGALAGLGVVTKVTSALVVAGLAAAMFLIGRSSWVWRERVRDVLLFGIGCLVVCAPWAMRTYGITGGGLPGQERVRTSLGAKLGGLGVTLGDATATAGTSEGAMAERSFRFIDLVLSPWNLTFRSEDYLYAGIRFGPAGIALLLLLPLALFAPRTRVLGFLAVAMAVSYVGWWFSPDQVGRHLLPTLAIAAVVAGAGVARATAPAAFDLRRAVTATARLGIVAGLIASGALFLADHKTRLPVDVIAGHETAAAYVARELPAVAALAAATAELPPDTLVGYTSRLGAGIYTEARLKYLMSPALLAFGETPAEILAELRRLGIDYFIWDRRSIGVEDWRSPLLATTFLRAHTRILAGDDDAYLFTVLPDGDLTWGAARTVNLIKDPRLQRIDTINGPWRITGKAEGRSRTVKLASGSVLEARPVPITAGQPYVLEATARCDHPIHRLDLGLRWFDARGVELGVDLETVIPGADPSEQFLWRRAPAGSSTVAVELAISGKYRCVIERVDLYGV